MGSKGKLMFHKTHVTHVYMVANNRGAGFQDVYSTSRLGQYLRHFIREVDVAAFIKPLGIRENV